MIPIKKITKDVVSKYFPRSYKTRGNSKKEIFTPYFKMSSNTPPSRIRLQVQLIIIYFVHNFNYCFILSHFNEDYCTIFVGFRIWI